MTNVGASIVLDSISPRGDRLTSFEITCHKWILAEINTHRMFSRSSASSRAIPIHKQIARVMEDPALPVQYAYNQAGMQASEDLTPEDQARAEKLIMDLRLMACQTVSELAQLGPIDPNAGKPVGLHKQWANRYLEPWMRHTVILTATDFDNFFYQRCTKFSPLAQPEFRAVADAMYDALQASTPAEVGYGEYHTPYILEDEYTNGSDLYLPLEKRKRVSTARCARVSYLTHDGVRDHSVDMKLFERLESAEPPHAAPLEMVATPLRPQDKQIGNFNGWGQFRHELLGM